MRKLSARMYIDQDSESPQQATLWLPQSLECSAQAARAIESRPAAIKTELRNLSRPSPFNISDAYMTMALAFDNGHGADTCAQTDTGSSVAFTRAHVQTGSAVEPLSAAGSTHAFRGAVP